MGGRAPAGLQSPFADGPLREPRPHPWRASQERWARHKRLNPAVQSPTQLVPGQSPLHARARRKAHAHNSVSHTHGDPCRAGGPQHERLKPDPHHKEIRSNDALLTPRIVKIMHSTLSAQVRARSSRPGRCLAAARGRLFQVARPATAGPRTSVLATQSLGPCGASLRRPVTRLGVD